MCNFCNINNRMNHIVVGTYGSRQYVEYQWANEILYATSVTIDEGVIAPHSLADTVKVKTCPMCNGEIKDKPKATSMETHHRLGSKLDHSNTPALHSVIKEMYLQDAKWGADRNHHDFVWNAILTEEVGEFAEAILHAEFGGAKSLNRRLEAVQIAAVALQIIECLDRQRVLELSNK